MKDGALNLYELLYLYQYQQLMPTYMTSKTIDN